MITDRRLDEIRRGRNPAQALTGDADVVAILMVSL
jgi:hypothetical protein